MTEKRHNRINMKIKMISNNAVVPKYNYTGDSGADLYAVESVEFKPFETKLIKTGIILDIPENYEVQIRPRSGMSLKTPMRIANSIGTVDCNYVGEICVIMQNISTNNFIILEGERIAQMVVAPVVQTNFEFDEISNTERGSGGFGSTGV